jgi:hypothetical protein
MAPVLPVVWVRDVLHQSEALSRRFWLTGQDRIDARLGQISGLLGVLERVYQLQREFMRHTLLDFVKVRALTALTRIVGDLEDTSLSEPQVIQIKTRLDALGDWVDATKQGGYYWADLSAAIDQLLVRVKPSGLSPAAQTVIGALMKELEQKKASPPKDLKAMIDVEETYARLKILWERRASPEFQDLLELQQRPAGLEDLFEVADKAAWGRLKADVPAIVLAQPSSAATVEEYDILRFELKPDRAVADSYVFRHGLVCKWAFEVQRKLSWTRRLLRRSVRPPDRFSGESREPAVVAYAHRAGTLTVSAVVENPATGDAFKAHRRCVNVEKSTEFRKGKLFEGAEMTSFAIAGVIAMVSGLSLLYAKNATFGSLSDYLGLFLWGVGVDQGKNLVQSLKS